MSEPGNLPVNDKLRDIVTDIFEEIPTAFADQIKIRGKSETNKNDRDLEASLMECFQAFFTGGNCNLPQRLKNFEATIERFAKQAQNLAMSQEAYTAISTGIVLGVIGSINEARLRMR
jgi:hypothetical protein